MRFHGNYCGPNWSGGKHQSSVVGDVEAVDEFDNTCRLHDATYATGGDLLRADLDFFAANFGKGLKRTAAAIPMGVQAAFRAIDKQIPKVYKDKKMTKNLRGAQTPQKSAKPSGGAKLGTVPAAFGYTIKMQSPKIVRRGDTSTITGSDFASNVFVSNSSNYEPAASVCITPAYFQNAMLGNLARTYEKFRVKRAQIEYIPSVPTSTAGQLVLTSTSTVKEPFIAGNSSTFLSRALSQGNAVATPLWERCLMDLPGSEWCIVDVLLDGDLDDSIPHEVQVYATGTTSQVCGILILHYEMEFKDPLYVFHPTLIPVPKGNGIICTFIDNSDVNATTDAIILSGASISFTENQGSVFRLIFQQARSTKPTGPAAWSNVARVQNMSAATTTSLDLTYTNLSMNTGTVLYGLFSNSGLVLYSNYEAASIGDTGGTIIYQTATTVAGTWSFLVEQVRLSPTDRVTTQ